MKIETDDYVIVIDPGIASENYFISPNESEKAKLDKKYAEEIRRAVRDANIIVLIHYHYDHHIPD